MAPASFALKISGESHLHGRGMHNSGHLDCLLNLSNLKGVFHSTHFHHRTNELLGDKLFHPFNAYTRKALKAQSGGRPGKEEAYESSDREEMAVRRSELEI